jgi:hemerythrin-like domain-containing protein
MTAAARSRSTEGRSTGAAGARRGGRKAATNRHAGAAGPGQSRAGGSRHRARSSAAAEPEMLAGLRAEHRHMAAVMALFSQQLNAIERGELVDTHVLYEIMDYTVRWPDRFHHPREDIIYRHVAEIDHALAADVRALVRDHDRMARQGREVLHAIERWRAGDLSGGELVELGRAYVQRNYEHMNQEEHEVFPLIDSLLTREDWRELEADDRLQPVTDPVFGRRIQRDFRHMARKVRRSLRHGIEQGAVIEWVGIEAMLEAWEVLSMAWQNGTTITTGHLTSVAQESLYITMDAPLRAPWRCTLNNTRLTLGWLQEMGAVYRDAAVDLARVNRERKDRLRLLRRASPIR